MKRMIPILTLAAVFALLPRADADIILVDYDDGLANGVHDAVILDGEFTTTTGAGDPWTDLATGVQFNDGGAPDAPTGSARNYVGGSARILGLDTGYDIAAGTTFDLSYWWIDKFNWDDATHTANVSLYYTSDNTIAGPDAEAITLNSGLSTADSTWEQESITGAAFLPAATGSRLYLRIETTAAVGQFARFDNIYLNVVPEPGTLVLAMAGAGLLLLRRRRG